mgnify:CR=1 FL=1
MQASNPHGPIGEKNPQEIDGAQNRYEEGRKRIAKWMREGRLLYKEDIVEGLENAPRAFIGMFKGKNFGKLLVRVSAE